MNKDFYFCTRNYFFVFNRSQKRESVVAWCQNLQIYPYMFVLIILGEKKDRNTSDVMLHFFCQDSLWGFKNKALSPAQSVTALFLAWRPFQNTGELCINRLTTLCVKNVEKSSDRPLAIGTIRKYVTALTATSLFARFVGKNSPVRVDFLSIGKSIRIRHIMPAKSVESPSSMRDQ